jgi:cathepsin A (carboxypeptidase C)
MYDVRLPCEKLGTCYPDDHLSEVMNNYQYRDAMNIKGLNETWEMCATLPHLFMMGDFDSMMGWKLSTLLDNGMPVLIYNGDQDYLCNYRGGLRWTNALKWLG